MPHLNPSFECFLQLWNWFNLFLVRAERFPIQRAISESYLISIGTFFDRLVEETVKCRKYRNIESAAGTFKTKVTLAIFFCYTHFRMTYFNVNSRRTLRNLQAEPNPPFTLSISSVKVRKTDVEILLQPSINRIYLGHLKFVGKKWFGVCATEVLFYETLLKLPNVAHLSMDYNRYLGRRLYQSNLLQSLVSLDIHYPRLWRNASRLLIKGLTFKTQCGKIVNS